MRVDVLSIFPEALEHYLSQSLLGRARREGVLDVRVRDLREGASDAHRTIDDTPFGGGAGMVFAPEPVFRAVELFDCPRPLFLLSPSGRRFDQGMARDLARTPGTFSLLCGRYEGVDERIASHLVDGEISIGDFVLAGGELASLVVIEAVARLIPGVIGNDESSVEESFSSGLLEYPQYTRPARFRDWSVPEVLMSGDHARIARWRAAEALWRTIVRRPDLIALKGGLEEAEVQLLAEHGYPQGSGEVLALGVARAAGDDAFEERGKK